MKNIVVGFLMSYDYEKLKLSIPPVYDQADKIYLALDHKQRTWTGMSFDVDHSFFEWLTSFDKDNKIEVYRADFYIPELSAIQNDTRERHLLALKMGIGNWLIQVDSDEIFIGFEKFVKTLRHHDKYLDNPKENPIQIAGFLINIYKYLEDGLLYVKQPTKVFLATNYPNYKTARKTKERIIYTNNVLLHECLSRTEEELRFKFKNWGHSHQFNNQFFDKWKKANKNNYKTIKDTFYLDPKLWKSLGYFNTKDLKKIEKIIKANPRMCHSKFYLFKKNIGQYFKHLGLFKKKKDVKFEGYFKND
ncbi:hypothetical protein [Olleya namhaensis]|uniref:hypothetical protein n=1 Tax=Olleya namhaensis TaxID=1144750 RepID=UPI002330DCE8|nr:hypothetical protein [Olleya namhaensis]